MAEMMLSHALAYAQRGFAVFPLHTMTDSGCSCGGRPNCKPAKHPYTTHGHKEATTDCDTIRAWWGRWANANIGIRTGDGLVVIDIDPKNGGKESLPLLGRLPKTATVQTGGGGLHLYFRNSSGLPLATSRGKLGKGIDVCADGGYVVAPPSIHESGERYRWARNRGMA